MNKKILIGSIIAVVILILVSFTGVVGYQTTSTIERASPLFSVRSKRAVDRDSRELTCDYVGNGEESILSIPKRDDRTALRQKFIDRIIKMDDNTFNSFIDLFINRMKQKGQTDIKSIEIVNALNQLRINQEAYNIPLVKSDKPQYYTENILKSCTFVNYERGCLLEVLLNLITMMWVQIAILIHVFITLTIPTQCIVPGDCVTI